MNEYEAKIARYLAEIGESVEIYWEPRNQGNEWYVGLADAHGRELPLHEHFASLEDGLHWHARGDGKILRERTSADR
jgi:hypothetical protein